MRRSLAIALVLLALSIPVLASSVKADKLSGGIAALPDENGQARGYVSLPAESATGRPGLIVIQEWWGLTPWITQAADRYAQQGYVVVAPDLYRGKVAGDADEAHQLMRGLPEDRAMADIKAAFEFLAKRPEVDPKRIGIVGWCMGGGYALAFGVEEPRLGALVINYGRLISDSSKVAKIKAPVQGNFGSTDKGIPVEDVRAFEKVLATTNPSTDFMVFEGAGHAFMNPGNSRGYDEAAADKAWARMDAFLAKHLKGK